jgi:predicted CXXCH cytochrome family protein
MEMDMKANRKLRYLRTGTGAVLILTLIIIIIGEVLEKDPHRFEGKCSQCHVGLKDPSILTRDVNYLCLSCHPGSEKRSHPSNIIPAKAIPPQFPLFRNKMVCITCHFPHRKYGKPGTGAAKAAEAPGPYLLRAGQAGKVFCYTCHRGNFISFSADSHAIAYKRAHTRPLDFKQKGAIDDNSRECLSCHDGTLSTSAQTQIRSLSWEHRKNIGLSHPISVDYEAVYSRKPRFFRPPATLDPRLVLIDGKIGCETCHNHYSKHKKHLVMDNFKSRLCLSCHNL